jgi:DNA-binding LytR/AlgR family response regulator
MKIRCLAVDDEAYAARIIADYISKTPFLELAGTTTNAVNALVQVQEGKIDLIFLDIQMPELSGIQFMKLCGSKCKVILTTAYPEYALEGYEHDILDYLLKPIAFDRFLKAANKAYAQFSLTKSTQQHLAEAVPAASNERAQNISTPTTYLFVKGESKNKFIKVNYNDILYIEGLKNYVSLFTTEQRIITYQTLKELEIQLPQPPFYRIHKSYIIPLDKIRVIDGNQLYIGQQAIPIGETYREDFFRRIRDQDEMPGRNI